MIFIESKMNNTRKPIFFIFLVVVLIIVVLVILSIGNTIPREYKNLVTQFIELRGENNPDVYELCFYKPEYEYFKQMMIDGAPRLLSMEVVQYEKINDKLYVFLTKAELAEIYEMGYSFVAKIDGEIRIIINARDIPDDLIEGVDIDKYHYYGSNGTGELLS